jgi:hypothetical protein
MDITKLVGLITNLSGEAEVLEQLNKELKNNKMFY